MVVYFFFCVGNFFYRLTGDWLVIETVLKLLTHKMLKNHFKFVRKRQNQSF